MRTDNVVATPKTRNLSLFLSLYIHIYGACCTHFRHTSPTILIHWYSPFLLKMDTYLFNAVRYSKTELTIKILLDYGNLYILTGFVQIIYTFLLTTNVSNINDVHTFALIISHGTEVYFINDVPNLTGILLFCIAIPCHQTPIKTCECNDGSAQFSHFVQSDVATIL